MGERSNFQKIQNFRNSDLKLAVCPLNIHNLKFIWSIVFRQTQYKSENTVIFLIQHFEASQLQNPEFRNNPLKLSPMGSYQYLEGNL